MSYALMTSTHVTYQVTLTVNVTIHADKALLFLFACVAYVFWRGRRFVYHVSLLAGDVVQAMAFTTTIVEIGLKAVMYGCIGVRL